MFPRRLRLLLILGTIAALALFVLSAFPIIHPRLLANSLGVDAESTIEPVDYLPVITFESTATLSCVPPEIPSGDPANEAAIEAGINQNRAQNGLTPLNLSPELVQAARGHSLDMAIKDFTDHTGSDGSTPWERMYDACYEASWSAEIIGWGFGGDPASMMAWWMNSSIHRAMILSTYFEDFGPGYIRDPASTWGHYWTVDFGTRVNQQNMELNDLHACVYTVEGKLGGSSLILLTADSCLWPH
ncbi:MAG: CAP domain-containing protein [Chloroflexota bacterium]|jgi:uncharacterized protein YkwD